MKCYHKKYFPSQFTHKSVRRRHAQRVGQMAPVARFRGSQGFKLLYVASATHTPHPLRKLQIELPSNFICLSRAFWLHTFPTHTHTPILTLAPTTNGAPSKKKLSKVLLFFFSLVCARQGVLLSSCAVVLSACSDDSNRHDSTELSLYCVRVWRCHFPGYPHTHESDPAFGLAQSNGIHEYLFRLQKLQIESGIIVGAVRNVCFGWDRQAERAGQIESWPKVNYYLCLAHVTQNTFLGNVGDGSMAAAPSVNSFGALASALNP